MNTAESYEGIERSVWCAQIRSTNRVNKEMYLTESQLRMLIRKVIYEHATDEHHGREDEHEEETDEEPVGDESIKKVYSIAKEVYNFV